MNNKVIQCSVGGAAGFMCYHSNNKLIYSWPLDISMLFNTTAQVSSKSEVFPFSQCKLEAHNKEASESYSVSVVLLI